MEKKLSDISIYADGIKQDEVIEARKAGSELIKSFPQDPICAATQSLGQEFKKVTGYDIDYSEDYDDEEDSGMY